VGQQTNAGHDLVTQRGHDPAANSGYAAAHTIAAPPVISLWLIYLLRSNEFFLFGELNNDVLYSVLIFILGR
jgi:hypothetical protein